MSRYLDSDVADFTEKMNLVSAVSVAEPGQLTTLFLSALVPGKYQPRAHIDPVALEDLAASIRVQGLMQPILVRPIADNRYEIIAGERRFRACALAGLTEIPVLVKAVDDQVAAAMALIENIQRENLNPLEEAKGLARLIQEFSLTHEDVASVIGRSRSAVSNLLRLLNLAIPVQEMLMRGDLDMAHARALLVLDAARQIQYAHEVVARRLTVRETEQLVARLLESSKIKKKRNENRDLDPDILRLSEQLSNALGLSVKITWRGRDKGLVEIDLPHLDALDTLLNRLGVDSMT
jgi:ParB family transcriptional regulator, chromosome partitioning protein